MLNGESIRKSGKSVGIAVSTSFFWRHKILSKIDKLPGTRLKHSVELEEVKTDFSSKGQRKSVTNQKKKSISMIFACDQMGRMDSHNNYLVDKLDNKVLKRFTNIEDPHNLVCSTKVIFLDYSARYQHVNMRQKKFDGRTEIVSLIRKWETWMGDMDAKILRCCNKVSTQLSTLV
jgi:hypothetical protein